MKKKSDKSGKSSLEKVEETLFVLFEISFCGLLLLIYSDTISTLM